MFVLQQNLFMKTEQMASPTPVPIPQGHVLFHLTSPDTALPVFQESQPGRHRSSVFAGQGVCLMGLSPWNLPWGHTSVRWSP